MAERIRVLRLIARLNVGGPALQAITLSRHLDPERFETLLVTGHCPPGEVEMAELLERTGVVPVRLAGLGRSVRPGDDASVLLRLLRLIREFRPHVLHTHTAKAGALGRLAGFLTGVPVRIHTFHGHVFRGYFSSPVETAVVLAERALGRLAHRIVAISERQREDLVSRYRIAPARKVTTVPLGFDLEPFLAVARGDVRGTLRSELGIPRSDVLVGIVGRIAPIKNHPLFLEAFALALREQPNLRALIVGGGEAGAVGDLRALAGRLGVEGRVHFLGYRTDLASLYADLDLIASSSDNEGTPVALIEAVAAGVPCVATAVGGVGDVLDDSLFGILVPPRDALALATGMLDLARDLARREELVRYGPRIATARYGLRRLLDDIGTLYQEALGERGIPAAAPARLRPQPSRSEELLSSQL